MMTSMFHYSIQYFSLYDYISRENFLIILLLLLFTILITSLLCLFISNQKKKLKNLLQNESFGRQYRIDLIHEHVDYFDVVSPEDSHHCSINQFLETFHSKDREEAKKWLNAIVKKDYNGPAYFEKFIYNRTIHDDLFAIFKILKIQYDSQIIHLEAYRFSNLTLSKTSKKNGGLLFNERTLFNYYEAKKTKNVAIYYVQLFSKKDLRSLNATQEHLVVLRFLQSFMRGLRKNCFLCMVRANNTYIVDLHATNEKSVREYANILRQRIENSLSLQDIDDIYDFRVGVYYQENEDSSLKEKIRKAEETALYARHSSDEQKILYYNSSINFNQSQHSLKIDEMNHLLNSNLFQIFYTPFVDTKTGRTKGFLCNINSVSKILPDIKDFEGLIHQQEKDYEYVELILENCLHELEDPSLKRKVQRILILPMPLVFFPSIAQYLKSHPLKDVKLSFLVDQEDFRFWNNPEHTIEETMNLVTSVGCYIALRVDNTRVFVNEDLLNLFSYYVLDDDFVSQNMVSPRGKILINNLLSQLLLFKIPIVASGIKIWSHAELLTLLGVQYLSGSAIAIPSETIVEVPKKVSQKVAQLNS